MRVPAPLADQIEADAGLTAGSTQPRLMLWLAGGAIVVVLVAAGALRNRLGASEGRRA